MMKIIGVTGGIGSGKSTVSRILEAHGAYVIDADRVARETVRKGEKALDELVQHFGTGILDENGELNRRKLAAMVFENPSEVAVLNGITHKYIMDEIIGRLETAKDIKKSEVIVLDVPIPVEHGFLDTVDEVWVVAADINTRVSRVVARSGISPEEALGRIRAQKTDEEYYRIADKIIRNDGTVEELERKVEGLLNDGFQGDYIG